MSLISSSNPIPKVTVDIGTRVLLARSLYSGGAVEAARRLVKEASDAAAKKEIYGSAPLQQLFELERDYGTAGQAAAAYRRLRDFGYSADPFGRHRLSLSLHHPRAPWQWEDALGIGALLLAIVVMALFPLLILVPIHYRSVVKELRGQPPAPPTPAAPWTLREAWYALAVMLASSTVVFYLMDYPTFHAIAMSWWNEYASNEVLSSDRALGNVFLVSSAIAVIALLPLLRRVDLRSLFLGTWSVTRSVLSGIGASIVLLILAAFLRGFMAGISDSPGALGTDTIRALQGIHSTYGPFAMLLFVAGLVPLLEEFVFRGVLLRAASRHIAFWLVVFLQAALFMVWHEDWSAWPVIFVLGFGAAWLARRSGGLLAPIVMHATNNLFAGLSLIGLSVMAERLT